MEVIEKQNYKQGIRGVCDRVITLQDRKKTKHTHTSAHQNDRDDVVIASINHGNGSVGTGGS